MAKAMASRKTYDAIYRNTCSAILWHHLMPLIRQKKLKEIAQEKVKIRSRDSQIKLQLQRDIQRAENKNPINIASIFRVLLNPTWLHLTSILVRDPSHLKDSLQDHPPNTSSLSQVSTTIHIPYPSTSAQRRPLPSTKPLLLHCRCR